MGPAGSWPALHPAVPPTIKAAFAGVPEPGIYGVEMSDGSVFVVSHDAGPDTGRPELLEGTGLLPRRSTEVEVRSGIPIEVARIGKLPAGEIVQRRSKRKLLSALILAGVGLLVSGAGLIHSAVTSSLGGLTGLVVFAGAALVAAGLAMWLARGTPDLAYVTGERELSLGALLDVADSSSARANVEQIKHEYAALVSDLCYRIEHPALFDVAVPETAAFNRELIQWDDGSFDGGADALTQAAELRVAFDAARAHAEAVGTRHYGAAQPEGERALKAARLATSDAATPGERENALRSTIEILEALMLYYLPKPREVRSIVSGEALPALPWRATTGGVER